MTDDDELRRLIENSSLGTEGARALRARGAADPRLAGILRRVAQLRDQQFPDEQSRHSGPGAPRRPLVVPAMVQSSALNRLVNRALDLSEGLMASGQDPRVMDPATRTDIATENARLGALLRSCPAGAFGGESSALVLTRVAELSAAFTADRDEGAALRLTQAALPHLAFLGSLRPEAFGIRRAHAEALYERGHHERALLMLRRLRADERRVLGSSDPHTELLFRWAQAGNGQLQEAVRALRALEFRLARETDTEVTFLWDVQCRLSWLVGKQGMVDVSASDYDGVTINRSFKLGFNNPDTLDARHSKGKMLVLADEGPRAVAILLPLLEDRARSLTKDHSDTLETLKYLHLAQVRSEPRDERVVDRAIAVLEHVLQRQVARHGPAYPMARDTAAQLGFLRHLRKRIHFHEPVANLRLPGSARPREEVTQR